MDEMVSLASESARIFHSADEETLFNEYSMHGPCFCCGRSGRLLANVATPGLELLPPPDAPPPTDTTAADAKVATGDNAGGSGGVGPAPGSEAKPGEKRPREESEADGGEEGGAEGGAEAATAEEATAEEAAKDVPVKEDEPSHEGEASAAGEAGATGEPAVSEEGVAPEAAEDTPPLAAGAGDAEAMDVEPPGDSVADLPAAPHPLVPADAPPGEYCTLCGSGDSFPGNEILLCDGIGCGTSYHQKCVTPAVLAVPEGTWLCRKCVKTGNPVDPEVEKQMAAEAEARRRAGGNFAVSGGFDGQGGEMLMCGGCLDRCHLQCLEKPLERRTELWSSWRCLGCKLCEGCGQDGQKIRLAICDVCDRGYHSAQTRLLDLSIAPPPFACCSLPLLA